MACRELVCVEPGCFCGNPAGGSRWMVWAVSGSAVCVYLFYCMVYGTAPFYSLCSQPYILTIRDMWFFCVCRLLFLAGSGANVFHLTIQALTILCSCLRFRSTLIWKCNILASCQCFHFSIIYAVNCYMIYSIEKQCMDIVFGSKSSCFFWPVVELCVCGYSFERCCMRRVTLSVSSLVAAPLWVGGWRERQSSGDQACVIRAETPRCSSHSTGQNSTEVQQKSIHCQKTQTRIPGFDPKSGTSAPMSLEKLFLPEHTCHSILKGMCVYIQIGDKLKEKTSSDRILWHRFYKSLELH